MDINIVGSLCGSPIIHYKDVLELLNCERVSLSHHGEFSGKPTTRIYVNDRWVLKICRNDGFRSLPVAEKWCQIQIKKEQEYDLYHPQRTWVVCGMNNKWILANITPRMQALHTIDAKAIEINEWVRILAEVLYIYITFTSKFRLRLDEGLSNFSLDDGKVYYLDDDIYRWDNFFSFSAMLGNWIRKSPTLAMNAASWTKLGEILQPILRSHSSDAEDIVHEGLIDQIVGQQETLKQAFLTALRPTYKVTMTQHASGEFQASESIAILADVHGNMPAFKAILHELDKHGVQKYFILGDLVGYGPNPKECIELIRQRDMFCIRGNHDHYVAYNGDVRVAMGKMAKWTADWTLSQLDDDDKMWLGALPVRHQIGHL